MITYLFPLHEGLHKSTSNNNNNNNDYGIAIEFNGSPCTRVRPK